MAQIGMEFFCYHSSIAQLGTELNQIIKEEKKALILIKLLSMERQ